MIKSTVLKRSSPPKTPRTYRGVKLQVTAGRTQFSLAQIRKAVETAVAKNADVLAGGN